MGPINKTLVLARFSFEQQTTQAAISKLSREFDRLTAAQDELDVRDFSINFSLTAWHLIDWLWQGMSVQQTEKIKLFALLGKPASMNGLRDLLLQECPSLAYCQQICTGSKHVQNDRPDKIETAILSRQPTSLQMQKVVYLGECAHLASAQPLIADGDDLLDAREEFRKVLNYFNSFRDHAHWAY